MRAALALLVLSMLPVGRALAQRRDLGSGLAVGLEYAGVRLSLTSRPPALALRGARGGSIWPGMGWRFEGDLTVNTDSPPRDHRRLGLMSYLGLALGPEAVSRGPFLRLGGGLLNTMGGVGEGSNLSPAVAARLGWEEPLAGRRYFVELRTLVPAWSGHGSAFVALLVGLAR